MTSSRRDSIQVVQQQRKVVLAFAAGVVGVLLLFARSFWAFEGEMHEALEQVGLALILVCIGGRVWCSLYLGGRKKQVVVRDGPFSLVRNPLYVFSVIGAAGAGLCTGSVLIALLFAGLVWLVFDGVVRREERYLRERLGEEYTAYVGATPRWIPSLAEWRNTETLEIRPNLAWRTLRDAMWFLVAFPLLEGLEHIQMHHWLPELLRIP